jgi:hypothetical protein
MIRVMVMCEAVSLLIMFTLLTPYPELMLLVYVVVLVLIITMDL